jgi:hypothetical protein
MNNSIEQMNIYELLHELNEIYMMLESTFDSLDAQDE